MESSAMTERIPRCGQRGHAGQLHQYRRSNYTLRDSISLLVRLISMSTANGSGTAYRSLVTRRGVG
jgi:hypothetical protein